LEDLPDLLAYELPIIVNISAGTIEEFGVLASFIRDHDINKKISGIEINVSCPNIKEGGIAFGTNPRSVEKVVKMVKRNTCKDVLIVTKLSPNVTDITLPAKAAIAGGTDVLSMINTLRGVAIDIDERRPFLGNAVGGVSGPAIKPIGVFMVYQCYNKIPECRRREVPIIGIGGISIWQDAIEYIMAGATAVGIGTAWFVYPEVFHEIKKSLEDFLDSQDTSISDLVGVANV
jgi:dihydroorotate dehydrogenase (NAD+) catalytic subunit